MKHDRLNCHQLGLLALLVFGGGLGSPLHGRTQPSAHEIMQKAVERAQRATVQSERPSYTYKKSTVTEELDVGGKVKERKEKTYEVVVESGLTYLKLLKVNGKNLPPSELKKQEERELRDREKIAQRKTSDGGDDRERFLTHELVAKYDFAIVDRRLINDRPAYVLTFQPKPSLPIKQATDRLLNQLAGKIWIDEQEFEIARIEIRLQSEVTLWGGILASVKRFTFTLGRARMEDGVWFNTMSAGNFEGRKLMDAAHVRTQSKSTDFRKLERRRG